MASDERLREALLELKVMGEREAQALAQSNAIVDGLAAITQTDRPGAAVERLLASIRKSLACDAVITVAAHHGKCRIVSTADGSLVGEGFPETVLAIKSSSRVADTGALGWWSLVPEELAKMRSMLTAAIALPDEPAGAIVCLSKAPAHFDTASKTLLLRLTALAAQALRTLAFSERNTLLAGVIDGTSASVSIADARRAEMPLVYVNDAFVELSGYSRAEVLGQNCRFLSNEPPDGAERTRLRETLAQRGSGTFVLRNRKRSGELFWNRLTLYPIQGPGGTVEHMVATQVDITAEREAEAAKLEAEERLANALSATSEGFLLLDGGGKVVFANERFAEFYGESGAHWRPGEAFVDIWARLLVAMGESEPDAERLAKARFSELAYGMRQVEERLPDGRIVLRNDRPLGEGGHVTIATDITSLKATERLLAQRAAAMDATRDGVAITDQEGRFVYMNAAHLALFGFEEEWEVLGQNWRTLYAPKQAHFIETVGMRELSKTGNWRTEIIGRSRDGTAVEQEVSLTLMEGVGLICVTRDIGERQQHERERARLREQLARAERQEAVGQLAAGIAHDFNNLLSVITTSADLIRQDLDADNPAQTHLEWIKSAGTQAAGLVGRLLETGRRPSAPRPLDCVAAPRESVELLRAGVPSRLSVVLDVPDEPTTITADPGDLLQVVLNLGINARDAFGEGAGEIRIALEPHRSRPGTCVIGSCEHDGGYVALSVSDTGPGIPEGEQAKIFRPYFSTKGDSGTGLGLAVVASVVRRIGGGLTLDSVIGQGTTFTVFWPRQPIAEDDLPAPSPLTATQPIDRTALRGRTAIVCDDVADVAQSIAAILESAGAEVAVCEDPRDVLDALSEDPEAWSVLLTDFDMPQMDGRHLATAARAVREDLPIVLCTALAGRGKTDEQFDAVLHKPVDPPRLVAAVAEAIVRRSKTKVTA